MNKDSDWASHWEYVDFDLEIGEESGPRKYPVFVPRRAKLKRRCASLSTSGSSETS